MSCRSLFTSGIFGNGRVGLSSGDESLRGTNDSLRGQQVSDIVISEQEYTKRWLFQKC